MYLLERVIEWREASEGSTASGARLQSNSQKSDSKRSNTKRRKELAHGRQEPRLGSKPKEVIAEELDNARRPKHFTKEKVRLEEN